MIVVGEFEIDREDFEFWLRNQEPDAIVGEKKHDKRCPIANYLKDSGAGELSVGVAVIDVPQGDKLVLHTLPDWVSQFVHDVDELGIWDIPASVALDVLEKR